MPDGSVQNWCAGGLDYSEKSGIFLDKFKFPIQVHITYQKGCLSEDIWYTKMDVLQALLTNPVVKEWWNLRMGTLSAGFYDYLDSLRSEPLGTWSHHSIGGAATKPE